MFIPFITPRSKYSLGRRKGGGGGGRGGSGGGSSGGSSGDGGGGSGSSGKSPGTSSPPKGGGGNSPGTSSPPKGGSSSPSGGNSPGGTGPSSPGKMTPVPLAGSTANGKTSATAYGPGGGSQTTIPSGQIFSGRPAGGGMRNQIYGTSMYGSGYPGITGRGVFGRGFPFWFWPIVWVGMPVGSYLNDPEYGLPGNTSRPGGPMAEATFVSNSTNTTFYVVSDNSTVSSLISSINANCSSSLSSSSSKSPQPYNVSAPGAPRPEQVIQYYRASSISLALNGYNNSATLSSDPNAPNSPLPSGIDMTLLNCLNNTIALSAPLVSSASLRYSAVSGMPFLALVWLVWWMFSLL